MIKPLLLKPERDIYMGKVVKVYKVKENGKLTVKHRLFEA